MLYSIGIDVGGTSVKIGLVDEKFNVVRKDAYSVSFDNYKTPIFTSVKKGLEDFINDNEIDMSNVYAIGVSSTGQIDSNLARVVGSAGHLGDYSNVDFRAELGKCWNKPIHALNDANAAALGELACGAMKGYSQGVMLVIGTGIGAGVVVDGKILNGRNGFAGEIGHTSIDCNGELCTCGNIGCYERLASTIALVRKVETETILKEQFKDSEGNYMEINGKSIFDMYEAGNKVIAHAVEKWVAYVALGIANVINIFNPEIIVIGGAVSERAIFMEMLHRNILKYSLSKLSEGVEIVSARQANDAGIIGAVKFALMQMQED